MNIVHLFTEALDKAQAERKKTSVFHSLVLIHASELEGFHPLDFCRSVGLPDSYHTEFTKMIVVAKRLPELGFTLTRKGQ